MLKCMSDSIEIVREMKWKPKTAYEFIDRNDSLLLISLTREGERESAARILRSCDGRYISLTVLVLILIMTFEALIN